MCRPFIPSARVEIVLVDERMPENMKGFLGDRGITTIDAFRSKTTYDAISGHPDISFCPVGEGEAVVSPESFDYYEKKLSKHGFKIIKGRENPGCKYPSNIGYNAAIMGKTAIHKFNSTDPILLSELELRKIKRINTKQGYSKCSICITGEDSIITDDLKIHEIAENAGIDSLLVKKGSVILEGFDYGFIGGCSGLISENEIFFAGDIFAHEDADSICEFLKSKGIELVCPPVEGLLDLGSIIPLKQKMNK